MKPMRIGIVIAALAHAVTVGAVARAAPSPPPSTAQCDEVILQTKFPYPSSGSRVVLGVISVPPAYLPNVYATRSRPWSYWRKAGLIVRADRGPVVVSVAREWRHRVAIRWGNTPGTVNALRIARCSTRFELRDKDQRGTPKMGNAYAGGFYLRSRSACVPLVFRVGQRSEVVRFGIGRRCPAS
jgi:hypothetical protein